MVVCHLFGEPESEFEDLDNCNFDHLDIKEVYLREMVFEAFTGLSGDKILDILEVNSTETIPVDIPTIVEDGNNYDQSHLIDMVSISLTIIFV